MSNIYVKLREDIDNEKVINFLNYFWKRGQDQKVTLNEDEFNELKEKVKNLNTTDLEEARKAMELQEDPLILRGLAIVLALANGADRREFDSLCRIEGKFYAVELPFAKAWQEAYDKVCFVPYEPSATVKKKEEKAKMREEKQRLAAEKKRAAAEKKRAAAEKKRLAAEKNELKIIVEGLVKSVVQEEAAEKKRKKQEEAAEAAAEKERKKKEEAQRTADEEKALQEAIEEAKRTAPHLDYEKLEFEDLENLKKAEMSEEKLKKLKDLDTFDKWKLGLADEDKRKFYRSENDPNSIISYQNICKGEKESIYTVYKPFKRYKNNADTIAKVVGTQEQLTEIQLDSSTDLDAEVKKDTTLYPYQKQAVNELRHGGLLYHRAGSGKTLTSILALLKMSKKNDVIVILTKQQEVLYQFYREIKERIAQRGEGEKNYRRWCFISFQKMVNAGDRKKNDTVSFHSLQDEKGEDGEVEIDPTYTVTEFYTYLQAAHKIDMANPKEVPTYWHNGFTFCEERLNIFSKDRKKIRSDKEVIGTPIWKAGVVPSSDMKEFNFYSKDSMWASKKESDLEDVKFMKGDILPPPNAYYCIDEAHNVFISKQGSALFSLAYFITTYAERVIFSTATPFALSGGTGPEQRKKAMYYLLDHATPQKSYFNTSVRKLNGKSEIKLNISARLGLQKVSGLPGEEKTNYRYPFNQLKRGNDSSPITSALLWDDMMISSTFPRSTDLHTCEPEDIAFATNVFDETYVPVLRNVGVIKDVNLPYMAFCTPKMLEVIKYCERVDGQCFIYDMQYTSLLYLKNFMECRSKAYLEYLGSDVGKTAENKFADWKTNMTNWRFVRKDDTIFKVDKDFPVRNDVELSNARTFYVQEKWKNELLRKEDMFGAKLDDDLIRKWGEGFKKGSILSNKNTWETNKQLISYFPCRELKCGMFTGKNVQQRLVDKNDWEEGEINVLLCSQAVEEGIDFQFKHSAATHVLFLSPIGGFDKSVQISARVIRKRSHMNCANFDKNVYTRFFYCEDSAGYTTYIAGQKQATTDENNSPRFHTFIPWNVTFRQNGELRSIKGSSDYKQITYMVPRPPEVNEECLLCGKARCDCTKDYNFDAEQLMPYTVFADNFIDTYNALTVEQKENLAWEENKVATKIESTDDWEKNRKVSYRVTKNLLKMRPLAQNFYSGYGCIEVDWEQCQTTLKGMEFSKNDDDSYTLEKVCTLKGIEFGVKLKVTYSKIVETSGEFKSTPTAFYLLLNVGRTKEKAPSTRKKEQKDKTQAYYITEHGPFTFEYESINITAKPVTMQQRKQYFAKIQEQRKEKIKQEQMGNKDKSEEVPEKKDVKEQAKPCKVVEKELWDWPEEKDAIKNCFLFKIKRPNEFDNNKGEPYSYYSFWRKQVADSLKLKPYAAIATKMRENQLGNISLESVGKLTKPDGEKTSKNNTESWIQKTRTQINDVLFDILEKIFKKRQENMVNKSRTRTTSTRTYTLTPTPDTDLNLPLLQKMLTAVLKIKQNGHLYFDRQNKDMTATDFVAKMLSALTEAKDQFTLKVEYPTSSPVTVPSSPGPSVARSAPIPVSPPRRMAVHKIREHWKEVRKSETCVVA